MKNKIRKVIREEIKKLKSKKSLKEAATKLGYLKEVGKGFKGDSPMPFRDNPDANDEWSKKRIAQDSATIKKTVNLKMDSQIGKPVTVEYNPKSNLKNVKISWGDESHTVDFEAGDVIDDHGNEGMDIETMADSDDGRWQFILDAYAEATYPMTGDFADWDFDELIVQSHPDLDNWDDEDDDMLDEDDIVVGFEDGSSDVIDGLEKKAIEKLKAKSKVKSIKNMDTGQQLKGDA